jgi:putative acetyltransferase
MYNFTMSKLQIRSIKSSDDAVLATIVRNTLTEFNAAKPGTVFYDPTTDHLSEVFKQHRSAYFVAELDGKIIGGAGYFPTEGLPEETCELVKMYLLPEGRGKGIGRMLIEKSIDAAKKDGYSRMYLETMPELKAAIGMYEKCGFKFLKGPMGNSGHHGCDMWMIRDL